MEQKEFQKRSIYTNDDSGKVFLSVLIGFFAFSLLSAKFASWINVSTTNIWYNLATQILYVGMIVGIWLFHSLLCDVKPKAVGFRPKQKWHTYLIVIILAVIVLFGVQYLVTSSEDLLKLVGFPVEEGVGDFEPTNFGLYIYDVFILALIPAFCEELMFRGIIYRGLKDRFSDWGAIALSSVMFALLHCNLQQLIYPILFGLFLGWIVKKTGSLLLSMIAHFINNFLVVTFAFIKNTTGFTLELPKVWWAYLLSVALAGVVFGICILVDKFYFKKHKNEEKMPQKTNKTSTYLVLSLIIGVVLFVMVNVLVMLTPAAA